MTGPRVTDCTACDGMGFGRCEETGIPVACEGCQGSGRLADCFECHDLFPLPEAQREGAFCDGCRLTLDARDHDADRARLGRWVA